MDRREFLVSASMAASRAIIPAQLWGLPQQWSEIPKFEGAIALIDHTNRLIGAKLVDYELRATDDEHVEAVFDDARFDAEWIHEAAGDSDVTITQVALHADLGLSNLFPKVFVTDIFGGAFSLINGNNLIVQGGKVLFK